LTLSKEEKKVCVVSIKIGIKKIIVVVNKKNIVTAVKKKENQFASNVVK